jgi:hypothetical protein
MALEAGVSAELIAKAFLAAHSPALLIPDRPSRDTLLHLTGQGALAATDLHEIQTIGMLETFKRVRYLLPTFSYTPSATGIWSPRAMRSHILVRPRTSRALLAQAIGDWGTGSSFMEDYWDDRADTVRHLLDESAAEGRRRALAKVSIAQLNFQRQFGRLQPSERQVVASTLAGRGAWAAAAELGAECPACGQAGVLAFDGVDVGAPFPAPLWSTGEPALYVHQREEVVGFDCSVCGLSLEGEEAAAAGLTWEIQMPDRLVEQIAEPDSDPIGTTDSE